MVSAISIGTVICIVAAIAGDTSQDLKTGYLLGATPKKQQIGELIGVVAAGLAIGGVLYLLNTAWGYGSAEVPAPQATLMKMIVEGSHGRQASMDTGIYRCIPCNWSGNLKNSGYAICYRSLSSNLPQRCYHDRWCCSYVR